jgi:hypothetical protein
MEIFRYLVSLIIVIPNILVLAAIILLLNKQQSTIGYVLLITCILSIVIQVISVTIPNIMHLLEQSKISFYYIIIRVAGFLNSTVFGIGLILLIKQLVKPKTDSFRTSIIDKKF